MSSDDATETDETTTPRCRTCERVEVPEHTWDCPACLNSVRQDIRQIADLYATLPAEVEHRGVESEAMHLIGPAANPEARGHLEASVAAGRVSPDMLEDGTGTHPLLTLATLSMIVRDSLGHDEPDDRATVMGEAGYLDRQLTTLSHDAWFDMPDMAASVRKCRAHLENVLRAGDRAERGAPCPGDYHLGDERPRPRLVKHWGHEPTRDEWRCPNRECGEAWGEKYYRGFVEAGYRAHADALTATDMEKQYGVKPGTLRAWVTKKWVERRGYDGQRRQLYDVAGVKAMQKQNEVAA